MTIHRRVALSAVVAVLALVASSCFYGAALQHQADHPDTRPWWCHSTGTGGHHVDPAYHGQEKGMLSWDDCLALSAQFDLTTDYAEQWPTLGDAVADGYYMLAPYAEGMGTHHTVLGSWTPGPGFDPTNPDMTGTALDTVFEPARPEFLMYAGHSPDSELVGFAWFVKTDPDTPPEGFPGDNDWWHRHPTLCHRSSDYLIVADGPCPSGNPDLIDVNWSSYWMLHAWILDGWQTRTDVFTNHHPCLPQRGVITDPADPCWHEAMHGDGGHGGH